MCAFTHQGIKIGNIHGLKREESQQPLHNSDRLGVEAQGRAQDCIPFAVPTAGVYDLSAEYVDNGDDFQNPTMKVLVYEYITGSGGAEMPSPSLAREGDAMLGALIDDLTEMPDLSLSVLRDSRLPKPVRAHATIAWPTIGLGDDAFHRFTTELGQTDAVWPIAPETAGILEGLCQTVESTGKSLLTSPSSAVRIAASKHATAETLKEQAIPVVPTVPWSPGLNASPYPFPVVLKADDGVGCEQTRIIRNAVQWDDWARHPAGRNCVLQPLIDGEPLSLSGLFAQGQAVLLSVNRQHIRQRHDTFVFDGCTVNAIDRAEGIFSKLLDRIAVALPGLWGYAGIDLIRKGDDLTVLEINPRLTSSYPGLKPALGINPARLVMELWQSGQLPRLPSLPLKPVGVIFEDNW